MYASSGIQSKFLTSVSVCWWARCSPWEVMELTLSDEKKVSAVSGFADKTPLRNDSNDEWHFRSRKTQQRGAYAVANTPCLHSLYTSGMHTRKSSRDGDGSHLRAGLCLTKAPIVHVPCTASRKRHFEPPPRNSVASHSRSGREGRRKRGGETKAQPLTNWTRRTVRTVKTKGIKWEKNRGKVTSDSRRRRKANINAPTRVDRGLNTKSGTGIPSSSTGGAVAYCVNINKYSWNQPTGLLSAPHPSHHPAATVLRSMCVPYLLLLRVPIPLLVFPRPLYAAHPKTFSPRPP